MKIINISSVDKNNEEVLINMLVEDVCEERERFGKVLDGEDYTDNSWLVSIGQDRETGETNWVELYYISNRGLVKCDKTISMSEEEGIEKYIKDIGELKVN